jgi:hypothetical protein
MMSGTGQPFVNPQLHFPEMQRAAVVLPPELEALVLPMCQRRQGNGLRSLLCLDSTGIQSSSREQNNQNLFSPVTLGKVSIDSFENIGRQGKVIPGGPNSPALLALSAKMLSSSRTLWGFALIP